MNEKNLIKSRFGKFNVYHRTEKEYRDLCRDIEENSYVFKKSDKEVFIVDAGAHIGLSTLYFKSQFPFARILCFEPSPETYYLLEKNIEENQLKGVTCINAALSDEEGRTILHGKMGWEEDDTRGNSITDAWGGWQKGKSCEVRKVKLSSYVNEIVDFLKLDVEGSEMIVLSDLAKEKKLGFIKTILGEIHLTKESNFKMSEVERILKLHSFEILFQETKSLFRYVPDDIKDFSKKIGATLTNFMAENRLFEDFLFDLKDYQSRESEQPYILDENLILEHN